MKLYCNNCEDEKDIIAFPSGPHIKAICTKCKKYIKFLSKREKDNFEYEEEMKQ